MDKTVFAGVLDQLVTLGKIEFLHHLSAMGVDSAWANYQLLRDFLRCVAFRNEFEDLALSLCEVGAFR